MAEIWFWQQIISPHMAGLAAALVRRGARVTYVAQSMMSRERAMQGWQAPELSGIDVRFASTMAEVQALVAQASAEATHMCEGIRANGLVRFAQVALARRGCAFWVAMESVEDKGVRGLVKRALYRCLFWRWRNHLNGLLAIGRCTPAWLEGRGVPSVRIFPFTYFLEDAVPIFSAATDGGNTVNILFVGQLIERKRLDLLIEALSRVATAHPHFVLQIIGSGPLEKILRARAAQQLKPQQVQWLGQLPMHEVRQCMAGADCLVLPSRHDGWGAVVSEALMAGTPVICSDRCGAVEAVLASGTGGVFQSGDQDALEVLLTQCIAGGRQKNSEREALAHWGQSLGAAAGANYLLNIFSSCDKDQVRPLSPWLQSKKESS